MAFLWALLPGAREARNHVLIGYAWLAALALWFGVPHASERGHFHELVEAVGRVGVGVAASFGAFMLGSLIDDLLAPWLGTRRAKAFTSGTRGGLDLLERMGDVGRAELERLEASIDRASAETTLRIGLLLPLAVAAIAVQRDGWRVAWLVAFVVAAGALLFQTWRRRNELSEDLSSSRTIREQAEVRAAGAAVLEAEDRLDQMVGRKASPTEIGQQRQRLNELRERLDRLEIARM